MSLDEDGSRRRGVFFTDSISINCIAEVGVGRKDVTVEILIRQIAVAPLGSEDFETINAVVAATDFHPAVTQERPALLTLTMKPSSLDQDGRVKEDDQAPYTAGSYICEVYLDGEKTKTVNFNIDYAPCPTKVIQHGTPCLGFYPSSRECPANGATGQPDPTCFCEDKGWNCQ